MDKAVENVGVIATAILGGVAIVWAVFWYKLRVRQLELSGFGEDVRAANMLGRTLAGGWMSAEGVREVMAAFNALGPQKGAALALAVQGLVSNTDHDHALQMKTLESKVVALVRTFHRAAVEDEPVVRAGGSSQNVKPA